MGSVPHPMKRWVGDRQIEGTACVFAGVGVNTAPWRWIRREVEGAVKAPAVEREALRKRREAILMVLVLCVVFGF